MENRLKFVLLAVFSSDYTALEIRREQKCGGQCFVRAKHFLQYFNNITVICKMLRPYSVRQRHALSGDEPRPTNVHYWTIRELSLQFRFMVLCNPFCVIRSMFSVSCSLFSVLCSICVSRPVCVSRGRRLNLHGRRR